MSKACEVALSSRQEAALILGGLRITLSDPLYLVTGV
jgi:hypothetical protein